MSVCNWSRPEALLLWKLPYTVLPSVSHVKHFKLALLMVKTKCTCNKLHFLGYF